MPDYQSLPHLSDEWLAEIDRRSNEFDAGAVAAIPWEQIKADALCRADLRVPFSDR
jgi:putative addiction module component (TIGR02574 family)